MQLFIKLSMWFAIVGVVLRGLALAFFPEYPRIVKCERWDDVLHIFGGLAWAFWAWSLVYRLCPERTTMQDIDIIEQSLLTCDAPEHVWRPALDALRSEVHRWVPVWPIDELPPIDKPVRVVWSERGKSDPKRAVWDGRYWLTPKKAGIYECAPEYWLYEPPIPEPPAKG